MTVADKSGDGRSGGGGDHLRGIVNDRAVNVEKNDHNGLLGGEIKGKTSGDAL